MGWRDSLLCKWGLHRDKRRQVLPRSHHFACARHRSPRPHAGLVPGQQAHWSAAAVHSGGGHIRTALPIMGIGASSRTSTSASTSTSTGTGSPAERQGNTSRQSLLGKPGSKSCALLRRECSCYWRCRRIATSTPSSRELALLPSGRTGAGAHGGPPSALGVDSRKTQAARGLRQARRIHQTIVCRVQAQTTSNLR